MLAQETNYLIPSWLSAILALATLTGLGYGLIRRNCGLPEWGAAISILFLVIFLFGKMAFCNYYYLALFFIWVWAYATWAPLDPLSGRDRS